MTNPKPKPKKKTWHPEPEVRCICGTLHRHHLETLAPSGAVVPIALDAIDDHQLIGLDGSTQMCSCGTRHRSHVEHLADVALGEIVGAAA